MKAEDRALKAYPIKIAERDGYDENLRERKGFVKGYHQAEKDLELTNADVYDIWRTYNEVCAEGKILGFDETSQEVLKRFNKERKEKSILKGLDKAKTVILKE